MPTIITNGSTQTRFEEAKKIADVNKVSLNSPDFILITPEPSIGIEKLRELLPKIFLKPYQSPQKIVVIENAHKMTTEAQNSFLKTLEEPPEKTIILLLVENLDQLLPTIISRCQVINLLPQKQNIEQIDISEIQKMPLGLRFKKASEIASTRESAQTWLKNAILSLHKTVTESADLIIKFQVALAKIDQNVNHKLVLENLLAGI